MKIYNNKYQVSRACAGSRFPEGLAI